MALPPPCSTPPSSPGWSPSTSRCVSCTVRNRHAWLRVELCQSLPVSQASTYCCMQGMQSLATQFEDRRVCKRFTELPLSPALLKRHCAVRGELPGRANATVVQCIQRTTLRGSPFSIHGACTALHVFTHLGLWHHCLTHWACLSFAARLRWRVAGRNLLARSIPGQRPHRDSGRPHRALPSGDALFRPRGAV